MVELSQELKSKVEMLESLYQKGFYLWRDIELLFRIWV